MSDRIDPSFLYPGNPFFLDYVRGRESVFEFFDLPPGSFAPILEQRRAAVQRREELAARLSQYNRGLDPPPIVLDNIRALGDPNVTCVITGQQAGFLGGPVHTVYKILTTLRVADRLTETLDARVVPVFWLATEDHDFTEVNHVRFLDDVGSLKTVSFEWEGRGKPIETLPITAGIREATEEVLSLFSPDRELVQDLLRPETGDDYSTWHARIWSRLFGHRGLIVVEPRTIRPMAADFFRAILESADATTSDLRGSAARLEKEGYPVPLDVRQTGKLFTFSEATGRRERVTTPREHLDRVLREPERYSADAALRPLLADSLFPTVASVVGPSELAYQGMLLPLYRRFDTPQPVLVPRHGYTLIPRTDARILDRLALSVADVVRVDFAPSAAVRRLVSSSILDAFASRRQAVGEALQPLLPVLSDLDPGLTARWRQTSARIRQQIDQLEERAIRADLARSGISVRRARRLKSLVFPSGRPQERVLSLAHFASRYGVGWIDSLELCGDPFQYGHFAITIEEGDE